MSMENVEHTLAVLHRIEQSLIDEKAEDVVGLPMESRLDWHRGYAAGLAFALQLVRDEKGKAQQYE